MKTTSPPPPAHAVYVAILLLLGISNSIFANFKMDYRALFFNTCAVNNEIPLPIGNFPPPTNYPATVTVVNVSCPYITDNGSITISNLPTGAGISYIITLYIANAFGYSQLVHTSTAQPGPSYTINPLPVGNYRITATEQTTFDTYSGDIYILEDSQWPVHPGNMGTGKAEGVDVVTDDDGNVYATGWFSGFIQIGSSSFNTNPLNFENGYLAAFDQCGNLIWNHQMICYSNFCRPTAICKDGSNNIIVVGYFYGTISFYGGPTLVQSLDAQVFIAKFDRFTGICLWAAKIDEISSKDLTIKGVCADNNDVIFVLGDFYGKDLTFHDFTGASFPTTLNPITPAIPDNYIGVYDPNGYVLYCANTPLSTNYNDKSGGICCATNPNSTTDVYITGQKEPIPGDLTFMGQHYEWNIANTPPLTLTTDYLILNPNGLAQEGTAVAIFDASNGTRSISFSGTQTDLSGTYPFFTHRDLVVPYPVSQLLPTIDLITTTPFNPNFTTDIAINQFSGEMYVAGGFSHQNGSVPANHPCSSFLPTNTANGKDLFFFPFGDDPNCSNGVYTKGGLYSITPTANLTSGCDEKISGICANNYMPARHTSFITGSFSGFATTIYNHYAQSMMTIIPPNTNLGLDCFISRVYLLPYGGYNLKDTEVPQTTTSVIIDDDKVTFYPNPATNSLSFLITDGLETEVKVNLFDITATNLGVLYQGILTANPKTISIDGISKGVYMLQFESQERKYSKKLIIL